MRSCYGGFGHITWESGQWWMTLFFYVTWLLRLSTSLLSPLLSAFHHVTWRRDQSNLVAKSRRLHVISHQIMYCVGPKCCIYSNTYTITHKPSHTYAIYTQTYTQVLYTNTSIINLGSLRLIILFCFLLVSTHKITYTLLIQHMLKLIEHKCSTITAITKELTAIMHSGTEPKWVFFIVTSQTFERRRLRRQNPSYFIWSNIPASLFCQERFCLRSFQISQQNICSSIMLRWNQFSKKLLSSCIFSEKLSYPVPK